MLSRRRLFYILIMAVVISFLFFLFNLDNDLIRTTRNNPVDEQQLPETVHTSINKQIQHHSYIVAGEPGDHFEELVRENILAYFGNMKLSAKTVSKLLPEHLNDTNSTIIFVCRNIRDTADLELLANYVKQGGKIMLASGLPDEADSAYLNPIFGIVERGEYRPDNDIAFLEGSIPYPAVMVEDAFTNYAYSVRLNGDCLSLLENGTGVPLVWVNPYKMGACAVVNGIFFENRYSAGIFTSALAALEEDFIYPIIGTKTVFLDAIPPLTTVNDTKSYDYYGRSAEAFVRDKLWGDLLRTSVTMDFKFTASFLGIEKNSFDAATANRQTFAFICRQVMQNNGEVILAGNHTDLPQITPEKAEITKEFFHSIFPNYNIHGYVPLYGQIQEEDFKTLKKSFPELTVLRCLYGGDKKVSYVGDFALLEDDVLRYPTITLGYENKGVQYYNFLSMLTASGLVSHSFDVNSLFTTPEEDSSWNHLNKQYAQTCSDFFGKTKWLPATTLSQAALEYRRYLPLTYTTVSDKNGLTIHCDNFVPESKFMLRSQKEIHSVTGAKFLEVSANYYMITAENSEFNVKFQEESR